MPSDYIKKVAKETDKTEEELEKMWKAAKSKAREQGHKDEYDYITGIFKKMAGLTESTSVGDVTVPKKNFISGRRCFDVDEEIFWDLPKRHRKHRQWFNKHYQDSEVADYARRHKEKPFYIRNQRLDMIREIKPKED